MSASAVINSVICSCMNASSVHQKEKHGIKEKNADMRRGDKCKKEENN